MISSLHLENQLEHWSVFLLHGTQTRAVSDTQALTKTFSIWTQQLSLLMDDYQQCLRNYGLTLLLATSTLSSYGCLLFQHTKMQISS